ncbi:MAG: methylmalonyl Co-A mutase-associated GTPase MeaB [Candidatus Marinimicrobia bacterium]|nr:methylmalonyl Co-A mutase-associated GTPase MeaB [Candidatus Neomarinimicrobiota bacterium]
MLPELIQGIRGQSRLSISQAISLIENSSEEGAKLLSEIFNDTGNAYRIGITGPPGAGKSSLTHRLISAFREKDKKVAVIAVDPTSPFSGGAVLGDRIRMTSHFSDPHVFVRSMATRGSQGGLALKTQEVGEIFDAAGYDIIIFETVGVGQIELDVIQATDSVVVVLVPESGDDVQMLKAGLMEIGNIFAINKADRPGANKLAITLKNFLSTLSLEENKWLPEVVSTVATEGSGINELIEIIEKHKSFNLKHGIQKAKIDDRYKKRVIRIITDDLMDNFWTDNNCFELESELEKKYNQRKSPYGLAKQLLVK